MSRQDRTEFYRSNRDYSNLLDDRENDDEEEDEDENDYRSQSSGRKQTQQDNHANQEYLERRQKLKELEREKLRGKLSAGSGINGRLTAQNRKTSSSASERKHLPYDNYGSFFGPSKPIVARRVLEEARAREEAELVATRTVRDTSEHRSLKVSSEASRSAQSEVLWSAPESRRTETEQQSKQLNEAALKLQRLKESRDYSFLFSDEDPTSAQQDTQPVKSTNPDKVKPRHINSQVEKIHSTAKKATTPSKPTSAGISTKTNAATPRRAPVIQEKQSNFTDKVLKPPAKPLVSKPKPSSEMGVNSSKRISGPGRPSEVSVSSSKVGISDVKKIATPSGALQKKVAVTGSIINNTLSRKDQSLPSQSGPSNATVRTVAHKPVPAGNTERKNFALRPENKQQHISMAREHKQPVSAGRVAAGYLDQRRPVQSTGPSKQAMKMPTKFGDTRRTHKRPMESESEDSFLDDDDDDDDGGRDFSSMIRKMFGYDPNKYRKIDEEDDRNMEADFRTIQMEEKRSARLAREEDERELALIEEEERKERARKEAKRRKLKMR